MAYVDETGDPTGKADGDNPDRQCGWQWAMVTPVVTVFLQGLSRSTSAAFFQTTIRRPVTATIWGLSGCLKSSRSLVRIQQGAFRGFLNHPMTLLRPLVGPWHACPTKPPIDVAPPSMALTRKLVSSASAPGRSSSGMAGRVEPDGQVQPIATHGRDNSCSKRARRGCDRMHRPVIKGVG
jgi:hypothetical protein